MNTPTNISDQYDLLSGKELKLFEDGLLENYLKDKMDWDEKEWFENILLDKYIENEWDKNQTDKIAALLLKNQTLNSKFQSWEKAARVLIEQTETAKIKNLVTEQLKDEDILEEKGGKIIQMMPKRNLQYILLAASVIILFGIGISIWLNHKPYSTEKLYAMYYEPYKVDFEISRDMAPSNEFITKAQKAFLNGETENTIKYLELTIESEPESWQQYLNLGSVLMVTEQTEKAISVYKKIPQDTGFYYETASWYLGLCYLKADKKEKAIEVFTQLNTEGKYYTEKTRDILNKIN